MAENSRKERPILFSGEMVRAILEGRKTQTRRIVKLQPAAIVQDSFGRFATDNGYSFTGYIECPYGVVGDQLWVRETWRTEERASDMVDGVLFQDGTFRPIEDSGAAAILWIDAHANGKYGDDWRSAMFMPRWASRITLEITGVRVERLQDITEEDAKAEVASERPAHGKIVGNLGRAGHWQFRQGFRELWDEINGKRASWGSNPWVWVVEFKKEMPR